MTRQHSSMSACWDEDEQAALAPFAGMSRHRWQSFRGNLESVKLYLSSYRLGSDRDALADLVETPRQAGIIFNALDGFADRRRIFARESEDLRSLGFECEELDLRSYFNDIEGLSDRLSRLRFLWVTGGNSFVLARAMTQSRLKRSSVGPCRMVAWSTAATAQAPVLRHPTSRALT